MKPRTLLRDRLVVSGAAVIWIVGTLIGFGVIGGSGVAEQGEGLFSDSATLIAPHGPAFSIWSVIYLAAAWGLGWVLVGRLTGELVNQTVAVVAGVGALSVLVLAALAARRRAVITPA